MPLNVNVTQHADFLEIIVTGTYDLRDSIDKFSYLLVPSQLTGISKVLIDYRDLSGDINALEKIIYALEIEKRYFEYLAAGGRALQVAYVGSAPQVKNYRPGLEIVKDSKMPFELFTTIAEAHKWLCVSPLNARNSTDLKK
jgi:hypothetical protein